MASEGHNSAVRWANLQRGEGDSGRKTIGGAPAAPNPLGKLLLHLGRHLLLLRLRLCDRTQTQFSKDSYLTVTIVRKNFGIYTSNKAA